MEFTQKAFLRDNRAEIKDKLYNIGYKEILLNDNFSDFICIKNGKIFYCSINSISLLNWLNENGYVDCGENEELFLAIAAMRDDSDYMQWFITENKGFFFLCLENDRYELWKGEKVYCSTVLPAHKATVEELINHFSK